MGEQPNSVVEKGNRSRRNQGGATTKSQGGAVKNSLKTRAVIFVDQTPKGELARLVREKLEDMGGMLGFKLRVVERTGKNILSNFPQTKTWGGLCDV